MSSTAPSPALNLVASLLELPIVSAGLQRAQSQGIQWGRRLRLKDPDGDADGLVEQAIQAAMWRTAGTGALAGLGGVLTLPAGGGVPAVRVQHGDGDGQGGSQPVVPAHLHE